ncbi:glutamate 5-kinase [Glaciecola sp. KUL10]|uniref:glutamate 5-kinase n=1 Tax=Glaciecola sp. (strain KUL10) TaxID=2161813 RepID=UPI000D784DFB|nr:glutamate 5-kinase [Glaciecola sp. KUL10]GBL06277.1 gamma-glutamyl kinase [Glaciecola sp. KUL10]
MNAFTWQRAVLKIGSALISPKGVGCSAEYLLPIAKFISESRYQGKEVILVSSGSVAAGKSEIKTGHRPTISEKQAMAAIGQTKMMANWARFFDFPCAQLLLTVEDLNDRRRYVNFKNTLSALLENGALPIINENDTIAVDEIKVGDNDNLAAHVALVTQADTLIICTDVDGLYTANPNTDKNAELISKVDKIDKRILGLAGDATSAVGTGGMITKLQAAQKCVKSGVQTILVNGTKMSAFEALTENMCQGTLFTADKHSSSARQQWLTHTIKAKGSIEVDQGAYNAVVKKGASLLAAGITQVKGNFKNNDAVDIEFNGQAIAKGLCAYSASELKQIAGCASQDIERKLGFHYGEEVIHRDNLVTIN